MCLHSKQNDRKRRRKNKRIHVSIFQFETYFLNAIRGYTQSVKQQTLNTHLLHISWIVDCCSCAENNKIINTNRESTTELSDEIVVAMQPVLLSLVLFRFSISRRTISSSIIQCVYENLCYSMHVFGFVYKRKRTRRRRQWRYWKMHCNTYISRWKSE